MLERHFRSWFPLSIESNRRNFEQVLMKDLQKWILGRTWKPGYYYQPQNNYHMVWEYHQSDISTNSSERFMNRAQKKAYDMHRLDKNEMPEAIYQFNGLQERVLSADKSLHLFTMPVSKHYWDLRDQATGGFADSLVKAPVPIHRHDRLYYNDPSYFADPSHLNGKGQRRFTTQFVSTHFTQQ
jgi:hypothetical protein